MREDELTAFASALLRIRLDRGSHFPADMFRGEQNWNIVLILFVADGRGERLSGRETLEREGGSMETGRRWITYLNNRGYIVGDGDGDLDDVLSMTPEGLSLMEGWLRASQNCLFEDRSETAFGNRKSGGLSD